MERYEQTQSLVSRIQQILREYPYGDTVLLELLQNADDAGASAVHVVVEDFVARADHPAAKSPALLVYNNSVFTDRDLANIQSVGGDEHSTKRHDGTKVGRFGIGFNSAYHLTDVISFVTNSTLVVFDPSKENLPHVKGEPVAGSRLDFINNATTAETDEFVSELLSAFEGANLGFSRKSPFPGTIFRLPLREMPTKLWREVHSIDQVRSLVCNFDTACRLGLVLLKNVVGVNVYAKREPAQDLMPLFDVTSSISDANKQRKADILRWLQAYTDVMKRVAANCDSKAPLPSEQFQHELPHATHINIELTVSLNFSSDEYFLSSRTSPDMPKQSSTFSVSHQLGPGEPWATSHCWKKAEECARYHHPISVPWSAAIVEDGDAVPVGRLMCFFPIRQGTGLPLHIHGYFELSSDRQSVASIERSSWNRAMCTEVVPFAYRAAIELHTSAPPQQYHAPYKLWPSHMYTDTTIALIASKTLSILHCSKVFPTATGLQDASHAVFLKPALSAESYDILSQCADNLALVSDGDYEPLERIREALEQHKLKCHVATSEYFRLELTKRSSFSRSTLKPMEGYAVVELFCRCTDDDDKSFSDFVARSRRALDVIPLHNGKGSKLLDNEGKKLFYAGDEESFRLAEHLQCARTRLIARLHSADDSSSVASDQVLYITANRRLAALAAANHFAPLDPTALFAELCESELCDPVFRRDPSTKECFLVPSPVHHADVQIPSMDLKNYCQRHQSQIQEYFASLPLLPGLKSVAHPSVTEAFVTLNVQSDTCIAVDPAEPEGGDARRIGDILVRAGAHAVDVTVFPLELLRHWRLNDSHIVSLLSNAVPDSGQMVVVALKKLLSSELRSHAQRALGQPANALAILDFVLRGQDSFRRTDIEDLLSVPIFPTIWNTFVPLTTTADSTEKREYVILPDSVPRPVKALLEREELSCVCILPRQHSGKDFSSFLTNVARVEEIIPVVAYALAMERALPPTIISAGDDAAEDRTAVPKGGKKGRKQGNVRQQPKPAHPITISSAVLEANQTWKEFCSLLADLKKDSYTPLLRGALARLQAHPFLQLTLDRSILLPPCRCVDSVRLPQYTCDLLLHLFKEHPNSAAPMVPDLSFVPPNQLHAFCLKMNIPSRLDAPTLVTVIQEFASLPEHLRSLDHCATLLRCIHDVADELSEEEVDVISQAPFIPVVTNNGTNMTLVPPSRATDPRIFDICPIGSRRPVSEELVRRAKSLVGLSDLTKCSELFGWDEPPPLPEILNYINSLRTGGMEDIGKNVWAAYFYLEATLRNHPITDGPIRSDSAAAIIKKNLHGLYFPEDGTFFEFHKLSNDSRANALSPWLKCLASVYLDKFPTLVKLLGIAPSHSMDAIHEAIKRIVENECVPADEERSLSGFRMLTDTGRERLNLALEYALTLHEDKIRDIAKTTGIFVPTSDGSYNVSTKVAYDFYSITGDQNASAETLHKIVHVESAKRLGMVHFGTKYLETLSAASKGRRKAFQARGQRQSLVNAIRRILGDYSDPQAIIMEMLQNADDAGATELKLYLDTRSFSTEEEGLLGKNMARCQGPSLVVYNDKCFSPRDVEAILEVGCGHKSSNQLAIGRFGVGFNAVYHLTDCPALVTGGTTLFLDPSASHLADATAENPGMVIEHVQEPCLTQHFPAQFIPFTNAPYAIDFKEEYPGTFFRLPIRTKPHDASLSSKKWTVAEVRTMLQDFAKIMPHVLLFLNHVEKISLCEIDANGDETLLAKTEISNIEVTRAFRERQLAYIGSQRGLSRSLATPHVDKSIIAALYHPWGAQQGIRHAWFVSSVAKPVGSGPKLQVEIAHDDDVIKRELWSKLAPFASCAFRIDPHEVEDKDEEETHERCPVPPFIPENAPLVHCFLPLPGSFGVPFHVHGCFALSSDRRGMSLNTTAGSTESREVAWNKYILSELVPAAAAAAFLSHPPLSSAGIEQYYSVWPTPKMGVSEHLALIGNGFFAKILGDNLPCVWSTDGQFVQPSVVCANVLDEQPAPQELLDAAGKLLRGEKAICSLPSLIHRTFQDHGPAGVDELTPGAILQTLLNRTSGSSVNTIPLAVLFPGDDACPQPPIDEAAETLAVIVKYIVDHVDDSIVLTGAPLVLLQDESVGIVSPHALFITPACRGHVHTLFPQVVSTIVHEEFYARLSSLGFSASHWASLGVTPLQIENLSRLLAIAGRSFIAGQGLGHHIEWDGDYNTERGRWLEHVWSFIYFATENGEKPLNGDRLKQCEALEKWPLIPSQRDDKKILVPLSEMQLVVSGNRDPAAHEVLVSLGVCALDAQFPGASTVTYVCKIEAINRHNIGGRLESAASLGRFQSMDPQQRRSMLSWLLSFGSPEYPLGDALVKVVRSLPIFEKLELCDGDGHEQWGFSGIGQDDFAIPPGVPVSSAAVGLFREAHTQLKLEAMPELHYFQHRILPRISAGSPQPNARTPPVFALSPRQEFEHLQYIGRRESLLENLRPMLNSPIFPVLRKRPAVHANSRKDQTGSLTSLVINYIIDNNVNWRSQKNYGRKVQENNPLLLHLMDAELDCLDQQHRVCGSDLAPPSLSARNPQFLSLLMQVNSSFFKRTCVPMVLWADPHIRSVIKVAGMDRAVDDLILQSAQAFASTCTQRDAWGALVAFTGRRTVADCSKLFYDLSISICQAALTFRTEELLQQLQEVPFLVNATPMDYPLALGAPTSADWSPPALFQPTAMAHCDFLNVCWTQAAIIDKELKNFPAAKPSFDMSLQHLLTIFNKRNKIHPTLLETAFVETYEFLVREYPDELERRKADLSNKKIILLPDCTNGPQFVAAKYILSAENSRRLNSMEPYYFKSEKFFISGATHSFILKISSMSLPLPEDVKEKLLQSANAYEMQTSDPQDPVDSSSSSGPPMELLRSHIELLRLLLYSSRAHGVRLVADPTCLHSSSSSIDPKEKTLDISSISIPTSSCKMVPIAAVCSPDAPNLLRRVRRDSILLAHNDVPLEVLRQLGVKSIVEVVQESPVDITMLEHVDPRQAKANAFVRISAFSRALQRILLTEQRNAGGASALRRGTAGGPKHSSILSAEERSLLAHVHVKYVASVIVSMVDIREPTRRDIGGTLESPPSCFDSRAATIYVCLACDKGSTVVDSVFLIALELNRLLNDRISNLAPLACILKHALDFPGRLDHIGKMLDVFGCLDLTNGGYSAGAPVLDSHVTKYGRCKIDAAIYPCCPIAGNLVRIATVEEETTLLTWRNSEEVEALATRSGADATSFVEFPLVG